MKKVYLDHTATTPLDPQAAEAMMPYFFEKYGNASSIHSYGQEAKAALDESRDTIAKIVGASSGEIIFVGSGTEATNAALKGLAFAVRNGSGKDHIITNKAEHHAVLETCRSLEEDRFSVTYLDVDGEGLVSPEGVRKAITSRTSLVSVMHANNEVGTINPIKEIAAITKENGIAFHTDAVQSFGKIPVNVDELGIDLLSMSAHKIYGPKGIGALYIRKGVLLKRLIHGGGQERGRRAGTENVPLAVGFAKAASIVHAARSGEFERLSILRKTFVAELRSRFPSICFNGDASGSLPHIVNVSFDRSKMLIDGEALLFNLDMAGVAVTSGSACTSGSMEPSHVLLAMGRDAETAKATIRFSMGRSTTPDDLHYVIARLDEIVKKIGKHPA